MSFSIPYSRYKLKVRNSEYFSQTAEKLIRYQKIVLFEVMKVEIVVEELEEVSPKHPCTVGYDAICVKYYA